MKAQFDPLSEPADDFELTPMIDVVFLLIAFFMTVSSLLSDELIKITMPQAAEAKVPEEKRNRQFVTVASDGSVFLGAFLYEDMDAFSAEIRRRASTEIDFKIYIRGDAGVAHREVRKVMEAVADAGVFDIIFATEQK
ncbi:MAG: ExbD/TolR family protein [Puniceicoccaceae bacterium]